VKTVNRLIIAALSCASLLVALAACDEEPAAKTDCQKICEKLEECCADVEYDACIPKCKDTKDAWENGYEEFLGPWDQVVEDGLNSTCEEITADIWCSMG